MCVDACDEQAVLLADALTSPILRLLDVGGNFKRYVLARFAGSDERARSLQEVSSS